MMQRGFSLVELSIVLVILGLLVGGVLAGQSLIRAAELRSVSTDIGRYNTAIYAFRDKYFALPGDITNATSIWGAQDPTPATCATTASTSALTCNGNGNGNIDVLSTSIANEVTRAWQHLASAGLLEGQYSGVAGAGGDYDPVYGSNSPASRITQGGYSFIPRSNVSGSTQFYDKNYGIRINFGADALNFSAGPLLRPEEAWNLDTKMDDGKPGLGNVLSYKSTSTYAPGCTSTAVATTADYVLTATDKLCALTFDTRL